MKSKYYTFFLTSSTQPNYFEIHPRHNMYQVSSWDFFGSPVAKTLYYKCRGPELDPWSGI